MCSILGALTRASWGSPGSWDRQGSGIGRRASPRSKIVSQRTNFMSDAAARVCACDSGRFD
eukprot:317039-Prymnesium_polylepis.1